MMHYRDATPADLPAVDALFREGFTATFGHLYAPEDLASFFTQFTPQAWQDELAGDCRIRLAVDAQGLAGYLKLGGVRLPVPAGINPIELRQLYLAERVKGTGVADALMQWAMAAARAQGAEEMWLTVYCDNHRAKRFYARYGFEDRGRYGFMVGNHEDEDRLMRMAL